MTWNWTDTAGGKTASRGLFTANRQPLHDGTWRVNLYHLSSCLARFDCPPDDVDAGLDKLLEEHASCILRDAVEALGDTPGPRWVREPHGLVLRLTPACCALVRPADAGFRWSLAHPDGKHRGDCVTEAQGITAAESAVDALATLSAASLAAALATVLAWKRPSRGDL